MNNSGTVRNALVEYFRSYSALDLPSICERLQIPCNNELDPMHSKATYLKSGLNKMKDSEIIELVKAIISDNDCPELLEKISRYLETELFEITSVTRRKIVNWLSEQTDLEGELYLDKFLNRIWDLKNMSSISREINREEDILRHMVRNNDWTYGELLKDVLKVIYVSDYTFKRFMEELVYPDVHSEERQKQYVKGLNSFLSIDGYSLLCSNFISGNPIYTLQKNVRGVGNEIKNIIFAGIGGKPDIVLDDSLSNTIKTIENGVDWLIYNQPISAKGLTGKDVFNRWGNVDEYDEKCADRLFDRLIKSMDSNAEKNFMWVYYECFVKERGNPEIPALIPQVYCHYDPKSAALRNGAVYVHQRMDFLMLFSGKERVVIEIDGMQHYSNEQEMDVIVNKEIKKVNKNIASSKKYAEMVEDDRKLKLYGYNVFRFGGYEFLQGQHPKSKIIIFFENLFRIYGVEI